MRLALAGILLLSAASAAMAQARGEVEAVGFDGLYRSNCWTPIRVRLDPTTPNAGEYKIKVQQLDLDKDRPGFTVRIPLNGRRDDGPNTQKFWVYFRPHPSGLGTDDSGTGNLKVFLCRLDGVHLVQLPVTVQYAQDLEMRTTFEAGLGRKLVLVVADAGSAVAFQAYENMRGLLEQVILKRVQPLDLPNLVLGYEAVDAIIWMNSDPGLLSPETVAAIQDYVREGGRLIVCQSRQWQRTMSTWQGDLLPVMVAGVEDVPQAVGLEVLRNWALPGRRPATRPGDENLKVPLARAYTKPGSVVARYTDEAAPAPYLVRWTVGMGTVSWVAQDLGDRSLRTPGDTNAWDWTRIWDQVLDIRNDAVPEAARGLPTAAGNKYAAYEGGASVDLAAEIVRQTELTGKGRNLVVLALLFFLAYWAVAGPGAYLYLLNRKRVGMSWFAFAACGVAATVLTVGITRLVLRGPAQVQHVTFVRQTPGEPTVAVSNIGLYIPRDGMEQISLLNTAEDRVSYITAFPWHRDHQHDTSDFPSAQAYEVPVRDPRTSDEPTAVRIPFRSTAKKLQVRWVGNSDVAITGNVAVDTRGNLSGKLENRTGRTLRGVHFLYRRPVLWGPTDVDPLGEELVMVVGKKAAWANGAPLELAEEVMASTHLVGTNTPVPAGVTAHRGHINGDWTRSDWRRQLLPVFTGGGFGDRQLGDLRLAGLLLGLFDRFEPSRRNVALNEDRYDIVRRGGRWLDIGHAAGAGRLVVFASTDPDTPLPFPMDVEGQRIDGRGTVFYQVVLPLDRPQRTVEPAETGT